jgi:hypothetical protein
LSCAEIFIQNAIKKQILKNLIAFKFIILT